MRIIIIIAVFLFYMHPNALLASETAILTMDSESKNSGPALGISLLSDVLSLQERTTSELNEPLITRRTSVHNLMSITADHELRSRWLPIVRFSGEVQAATGNQMLAPLDTTQGMSNIASPNGIGLYRLSINLSNESETFSLLTGFTELNSEFYNTPSSYNLLNSSFGIGADLSSGGESQLSSYPMTALGARLRFAPHESITTLFGVYDANPGSFNQSLDQRAKISSKDGFTAVAEANMKSTLFNRSGLYGVGAWSSNFSPAAEKAYATDNGVYAYLDHEVLRKVGPLGSLSIFARGGTASDNQHFISSSWAAGLNQKNIFSKGAQVDELMIGFTSAIRSKKWRTELDLTNPEAEPIALHAFENTLEFSYRYPVFSWLWIQPDAQITYHPQFVANSDTTLLTIGARIQSAL